MCAAVCQRAHAPRLERERCTTNVRLLLQYSFLKEKAIHAFRDGRDTFVSLPTGYGKSLLWTSASVVLQT